MRTQNEVSDGLTGLGDHLMRIHPDKLAVFHKHLAVDHRRRDIGAASGIHERGIRVGPRRLMHAFAVHDDDVGSLAGLNRSDLVLQSDRPRTGTRRHP